MLFGESHAWSDSRGEASKSFPSIADRGSSYAFSTHLRVSFSGHLRVCHEAGGSQANVDELSVEGYTVASNDREPID
jgi:hypothetical protein